MLVGKRKTHFLSELEYNIERKKVININTSYFSR